MASEQQMNIGSFNEAGLIHDLDKRGFSLFNCISEIIANSIENKVNAKTIKFIITTQFIYFTDDGIGMNLENITHMWDIFRANNSNNKSLGISGLGAKAATKILSRNNTIYYYTKHNSEWKKITVPWNTIVSTQQYTGQVSVDNLSSEDENELKI